MLTNGTVNHLQVCPVLGRNSAHDAVRNVLSHLVVQNGATDAANADAYDADVGNFNPSSWARVILEVSVVTIGSGTSLSRSGVRRLQ
jgi:hypothetical protein